MLVRGVFAHAKERLSVADDTKDFFLHNSPHFLPVYFGHLLMFAFRLDQISRVLSRRTVIIFHSIDNLHLQAYLSHGLFSQFC